MKNIVTIGGGTGHFTTLKALTKIDDISITAIVSVADSGGSSGILRDEFGVLPPGDVLQALLALSRNPHSEVLREFLRTRPQASGGQHNGGNLLLAMMEQYFGSPIKAYEAMGEMLGINPKDQVLPVTTSNITLRAEMEDGTSIIGETDIDVPKNREDKLKIKKVWLEPNGLAYGKSLEAINKADFIIMGPGDLYTSIIPVILVRGMKEALKNSSAKKIYIANRMTRNETHGFTLADFYKELIKYLESELDIVIATKGELSQEVLERYGKENKYPVELVWEDNFKAKLIAEDLITSQELARHDTDKLSKIFGELF